MTYSYPQSQPNAPGHRPIEASRVQQLFAAIAPTYDLTNQVMSLGIHRYWNKELVKALHSDKTLDYLDLCAGTGAITALYMKNYQPEGRIALLDFCPEMLEQAKKRLAKTLPESKTAAIEWITADATAIPLPENSFDRLSLAYGLRNISDPQMALKESYRLLREGGCLVILELTRPKNPLLQTLHRLWLKWVVCRIGGWISRSQTAYSYLNESINHFSEPSQVCHWLREAGFESLEVRPLTGQIATLFIARK